MIHAVERWDQGPASRLDALLKAEKVSSAAIARKLGVDPSTVTNWRKGKRVPNADILGNIIRMTKTGSSDAVLGLEPGRRALDEAGGLLVSLAARLRR